MRRRVVSALVALTCVLMLSGCTVINGKIYRVQWFKSGSCFVYVTGKDNQGTVYTKAIRVLHDSSKEKCYRKYQVGDFYRFRVDKETYQRRDQ